MVTPTTELSLPTVLMVLVDHLTTTLASLRQGRGKRSAAELAELPPSVGLRADGRSDGGEGFTGLAARKGGG